MKKAIPTNDAALKLSQLLDCLRKRPVEQISRWTRDELYEDKK